MSDDYFLIKAVEEQLQAVQQTVQQQAILIDELRGRAGVLSRTVSVLRRSASGERRWGSASRRGR